MVSNASELLPDPDKARDDGQRVAGDGHRHVAQVVLARAADRDVRDAHSLRLTGSFGQVSRVQDSAVGSPAYPRTAACWRRRRPCEGSRFGNNTAHFSV